MSDFSDLKEQVDGHEDRITSLEESLDSFNNDTQTNIDNLDQSIIDIQQWEADNEANIGQLMFPLNQDSVDLIKQVFPTGSFTLVNGTATIVDGNVLETSKIFISRVVSSGTVGFLDITSQVNGQFIVESKMNGLTIAGGNIVIGSLGVVADNSTFIYLIY